MAAGNPVYGNHSVMNATVPSRGKVQSLVERQRGRASAAPQSRRTTMLSTSLLLCRANKLFHTTFAHIGHPLTVAGCLLVVAVCVLVIDVLAVIQQRGETM